MHAGLSICCTHATMGCLQRGPFDLSLSMLENVQDIGTNEEWLGLLVRQKLWLLCGCSECYRCKV